MLRVVIVVFLGALLAACGGDDSPAEEGSANGQDAADDRETEDSESVQGDDFADLANQGFASAARVTYEMTAGDGQTQEMVLSSDGEQTAWLMPDARMIIRGDGTQIFCNEAGGQAQCFEMDGQTPSGGMSAATPFMGLATSFQEGVDNLPGFASVGEREIAGRTARCARFDPSRFATEQQAGEATLCVDSETGVMLSYETTSGQDTAASFTATDFGEPQASDFEAPAEPRQMDQMMDQMDQGGS